MVIAPRQVAVLFALLPLLAAAGPRGPFAQQLAKECDALLDDAVRRPYGWGWDTVPLTAPAGRTTPRHVDLEPPGSAGAALVLLWAGQLLDEPKYQQAAFDAARGIGASQIQVGKVPEHVIFGPTSASSRDPVAIVPDRSATRAGLVLLANVIQANPGKSELLSRSAQRASQWLIRQQADDGAWPSGYADEDAPRRTLRIIRLDHADYRDSTLVMLMLGQALGDPDVIKSGNKAVAKLISLRLGSAAAAPTTAPADVNAAEPVLRPQRVASNISNLWTTAYRLDGTIDSNMDEFPAGADMLATRLAMQTLLGAYLIAGQQQVGLALDASRHTAMNLREPTGNWRRLYRAAPTTQPDAPDPFFGPPSTEPHRVVGTFNLPQTLESANQLKLLGQVRYLNMLSGQAGMHQHISATVAGLIDNPFTLDTPVTRDEVDPYLRTHAERFEELTRPSPTDLSARVRRLWLLLLRTRLEMMQLGGAGGQ